MNLSGLGQTKHLPSIFIGLFLLALIIRMGLMLLTIDVPGDGPTRAIGAYQMFLSPTLMTYGDWLPGYNYLHFGFYYILADPAVTPRVVNVILGSLTVPIFWLLTATIFDHPTGLISALVLTVLPLDIGLSASSLTEPTFLFEFTTGSLMLVLAVNGDRYRLLNLFLAIFLLSLAVMTRYEGWVLIPVFVVYYYLSTRSLLRSVALAIALLTYPTLWTIGNDLHSGDPFRGFRGATGWFHGAKPVNWLEALAVITHGYIVHLGWLLLLTAVLGLGLQCVGLVRREFTLERLFYLLATLTNAAACYCMAIIRGNSVWDRYLLFGFLLILPFAILPFTSMAHLQQSKLSLSVVALLVITSAGYNLKVYRTLNQYYNDLYVTLWQPTDMINTVRWLKSSPYEDYVVLLTENGGESWYFPTFFPAKAFRHCVITWYPDVRIDGGSCLNLGQSQHLGDNDLFITSDEDRAVQERLEKMVGGTIGNDALVHTEGDLRVYDISSLVRKRDTNATGSPRASTPRSEKR